MKRAFTLIELILVILIVGILAAIVITRISFTLEQAKYEACFANVAFINKQIELYHIQTGLWLGYQNPATWGFVKDSPVGKDKDYFPDGVPSCPVTGEDYWSGPTTHHVSRHNGYTKDTHTATMGGINW